MLDIIALVAAGIATYSSVKHTVQLRHVLVIASASLILVLSASIPSQLFLIQTFWILFVAGIGVGFVSLALSYKYQALMEEKKTARYENEWKQRREQEKKQNRIEQEQAANTLRRKIRARPEETVQHIHKLLTKEDTEIEAFLETLPQETRPEVAVAINAVDMLIRKEQVPAYATAIMNYILNPQEHEKLNKHTEQIITQ